MKKYYLILVTSLIIGTTYSQTKKSAIRDAKITAQATLNMDFKTVFKHTYPPILEFMGGSDNAIKTIEQAFSNMKSQGFVFEKADVIDVSEIVEEQEQYRCYVYGVNVMKMGNKRITSKSYLLGIYDEEKSIWYFLEAEKLKNKALTDRILPGFKTNLNIPDDEMSFDDIKN